MLTLLNRAMLSSDHTRFATLVLASVAHRDGQVALRLTCAGHPPPLIVRDNGQVEEADTKGTLVGALERITVQSFETSSRRAKPACCTPMGSPRRAAVPTATTSSVSSGWRPRSPDVPGSRPKRSSNAS